MVIDRRWIAGALALLLVGLQFKLWAGDGGIGTVWRLHSAVEMQRVENQGLAERNQTLEAEVRDLKQGYAALEERARSELGMVGEEEIFIHVVE